ncbi:hypothetical protein K431DRAFT_307755 [Polychaeton citri CBS 116435]|uniref:Uncharacterized protein n=1 Tax=Polychaeton citri CBS 116435 TaxID=1314669 RepID=A0A9P4Q183_9PEZI|nr:hypothetical protein K431DRAFT_307755 [Polychaeton citri CBS 116435]
MAPNPIMIPRKQNHHRQHARDDIGRWTSLPLFSTAVLVALVAALPWARRWLYSGSAVASLILLYGSATGTRVLPSIPLWTLLASVNLVYAVASTSWLLYWLFACGCWPFVMLASLWQFENVAKLTRKRLRSALKHMHFTRDIVALFNLPALEIDTNVDGLLVVRGLTVSLSTLTIIAHGVELGLKVTDDIELAIYADEVHVRLFRRIDIGDVYASLKGSQTEMIFNDIDPLNREGTKSLFQADTPLLRAATNGLGDPSNSRPSVTREMTGGVPLMDSSPKTGLEGIKTLSPDEEEAHKQYVHLLEQIRITSHVHRAREKVQSSISSEEPPVDDEKVMRAAICAKLQDMPAVPHPPARSIRVTSLQNSSPPYVRDFLHRLPFLLRLLLMPLGYFHPIAINSVSAAGSGQWLTAVIKQNVFKHYASQDAEIRRLERKVCSWLADANFCLELTNIDGLGQVPLNTIYDVVAYLRFADIMAYRTTIDPSEIRQIVRLGGADATFTIPSFLLPHHEHLLPDPPTDEDTQRQADLVTEADGPPKTVQAEQELKRLQKDETEIIMSVHASLPACFDQSLLNFIAALVKATKVIEMDKEVAEADEPPTPVSRASTMPSLDDELAPASKNRFKNFAEGIRQNIKDNRTGENLKEIARDLHQSTKDGMKKTIVGGVVNDLWIAKLVGKVAAKLEHAQGDVGYSGGLPVPLMPYRSGAESLSKLMP